MNAADVNRLVGQLARVRELDWAPFQALLGAASTRIGGNPWWTFYEFDLLQGPFEQGELRIHVDRDRALLCLTPRAGEDVLRDEMNMEQWGEIRKIDANPRIPPEGTDAYIYDVLGVKVSFQFTHHSHRLRTVALEWGMT